MQQFYSPHIDQNNSTFTFDEQESKHIARVLRKVSGDHIQLTDGKGTIFGGNLEVISVKKCCVHIASSKKMTPHYPYVHMAVAPTKSIDRFEWFLEKATEMGVQRITPILCARSERKSIKLERCAKITIAAMKQSLGAFLPKIDPLTPLHEFKTDAVKTFLAHCADFPKDPLKAVVKNQASVCILIGPEGDFTPSEIEWANQQKIVAVDLGSSRLRTDTAALAACHTALLLNEA